MRVYHGTKATKVSLIATFTSDFTKAPGGHWTGLDVTDTFERARDYANAQASGEVRRGTTELVERAVVIALETDDEVRWSRRPTNHHTLDTCESTIQHGRVVELWVRRPAYQFEDTHEKIAAFTSLFPNAVIHVF